MKDRRQVSEVCIRCEDRIYYYINLRDDVIYHPRRKRKFKYCCDCLSEMWHQVCKGQRAVW